MMITVGRARHGGGTRHLHHYGGVIVSIDVTAFIGDSRQATTLTAQTINDTAYTDRLSMAA